MKTFLQICQEISRKPNSELKSNIVSLSDVDAEQINTINEALSNIWNETVEWDLRHKSTTFSTVIGDSTYSMVNGIIKENGVKISGNTEPLTFLSSHEDLTDASGTPEYYWLEGNEIILYPTPDSVKTVTVKYINEYAVKTAEAVEQDFFVNTTDVLNIPARVEKYFIDCIAHLTNQMLNADQTDEEYLEHGARYAKALQILKKADKGSLDNKPRFVV